MMFGNRLAFHVCRFFYPKVFPQKSNIINSMILKTFITPILFLYPDSTGCFDTQSPVLLSLFFRKQCGKNLLLFMEADALRHALITFFFFLQTGFNSTNQRYINLILKEKDEEKNKGIC